MYKGSSKYVPQNHKPLFLTILILVVLADIAGVICAQLI